MKKILLLSAGMLAFVYGVFAQQWSGASGSTGTIYRNGNVGIGHTSSNSVFQTLHVRNPSGNAGIRINGKGDAFSQITHWEFELATAGCQGCPASLDLKWGSTTSSTDNPSNFTTVARFMSGTLGHVVQVFGTMQAPTFRSSPSYFLSPSSTGTSLKVAGKIISKEIEVVAMNTNSIKSDDIKTGTLNVNINNVADYVFEDDYNLRSLEEVEAFIKENKHLPDLPKGNDLEEKGMDVAQMTNLLLQKIEELTLYTIELEKKVKLLENAAKNQ